MKKLVPWSCALAATLLAGAALSASAAQFPAGMIAVPLVQITNDRDTSVSEIALMLDPQKVVRGLYIATRENSQTAPDQAKGQVIPLARIETRDGAVVGQGQGVKAILLRGKIQPTGGHGELVIRYLSNGVFHSYKECEVTLHRVGPNQWELNNADNHHAVDRIHVETWALGISTLHNVCPSTRT